MEAVVQPIRLHPDDIRAIAQQVAALSAGSAGEYTDAQGITERYGFKDPGWAYRRKRELGAVPMGDGPKPRWRFPIEAADRYMAEQAAARQAKNGPRARSRKGGPARTRQGGDPKVAARKPLIPLYG
jgi:hypothetical protein